MDKYLQEILLAQLSVILPELGALTYDKTKKEASFNPYVKYNDEKFENYLVEKHNIDKQEATNMVAQYVKEIQNHVNKGESFVMYNFGRFTKSDSGDVEFQNWSEFSSKAEQKEEPKPTAETKKEDDKKKTTPKVEEKKTTPPKTESKASPKIDDKKTTSLDKKEDKKTAVVPHTPSKTESTKPVTDKKTPIKKEDKKPIKKEKAPKEKKEKKKRGTFFYVNIALLLLLIACAVFIYLNYNKVQKFFGFAPSTEQNQPSDSLSNAEETANNEYAEYSEDSVDTTAEISSDTSNEEEMYSEEGDAVAEGTEIDEEIPSKVGENTAEETVSSSPASQTTAVPSSSGSYHIIGGGFQNPENAERFAQTLQGKGFSAHVVGVFDGLSMVAIQSYNSMDEAQSALSSVRSQSGVSSAWIFKH